MQATWYPKVVSWHHYVRWLAFDRVYVSTGSAGIIQTIQRFSHRALVAGILGIIATVGWAVQGLGNAFYYRQVVFFSARLLRGYSLRGQIWAHHTAAGHTMEKVRRSYNCTICVANF
jgi:hypothetical protein